MATTLALLLIAGAIGVTDVVYFHLWKLRLYQRRASFKEEITHLLRELLFPVGLAILLLGQPSGAWFWALLVLFAVDFGNNLLDVLFEPQSRRPAGVPHLELAVHFFGVTLLGAAVMSYLIAGWGGRNGPTALVPYGADSLPPTVMMFGWFSAVAGVLLLLTELTLFVRAWTTGRLV